MPRQPRTEKQKILSQLNQQKEILGERKRALKRGLPHLYGYPWYTWARNFFESRNKVNILVAGNQLSKSSTQIRKIIDWATNKYLWPKLWPGKTPSIFWYYYPNFEIATAEFHDKWVKEFLPRDEFKRDPVYGWEADFTDKQIDRIRFYSGITITFKTYSQKPISHSASTVYAIFADEEMPEDLYGEIIFRLAATDGYFSMVLTNTLNQQFWYRVIEGKGDNELLPDAWKLNVSAWDCLVYEDGTNSPWTEERIKRLEDSCKSENEKLRRVYGRYVADDSFLEYPVFDPTKQIIKTRDIPQGWRYYGAVDPGSGGKAHPAAITIVAVNSENTLGYVCRGWRGDGILTTAADVLEKYREMTSDIQMTLQSFDYSAKDFGTLAERSGISFLKADKDRTRGGDILSTVLKFGMLYIFDEPELRKLGSEFLMLRRGTSKTVAKDDFIDSLRYCIMLVPWDFNNISEYAKNSASTLQIGDPLDKPWTQLTDSERMAWEIRERRRGFDDGQKKDSSWKEFDEECNYWNEQYGE